MRRRSFELTYPTAARQAMRAFSSEFRHRADQPLDIFRPRQPVVTVLDQGEHDVVVRQPGRELDRVLPGNILVLHTLQDAHRATALNQTAQQKMIASVFNQLARDEVRFLGIGRWALPETSLLDLMPH